MERMDEARRVFDVVVEEMNEDQERKHREILNESTEMLPFYGLTRIDGAEEQKVEAGEDNQQEILTSPGKMNTERDTEGKAHRTRKGVREDTSQGADDQYDQEKGNTAIKITISQKSVTWAEVDCNEIDEVETSTKFSGQKESRENEDTNIMPAGGAQQKNPQLKDTTNTGE